MAGDNSLPAGKPVWTVLAAPEVGEQPCFSAGLIESFSCSGLTLHSTNVSGTTREGECVHEACSKQSPLLLSIAGGSYLAGLLWSRMCRLSQDGCHVASSKQAPLSLRVLLQLNEQC